MFHKVVQISQALQVPQYLVPINLQVLMHKNVAEAGDLGEFLCQLTRKNTDFSQHLYRAVGVARFLQLLHGDNPIGDIDARLCRNLEVALYYVLEIGIDANSLLVLVLSGSSLSKHPFSRYKRRSIPFHSGVIILPRLLQQSPSFRPQDWQLVKIQAERPCLHLRFLAVKAR